MSMSKTERTQAIVLRRTNYGEADRIVQLLTPLGRKNVMARGVRREKSKLAGGIELFAVSDVVIGVGKGELGILTSARLVRFYRHILDDYDRMQFGYEVVRQVSRASDTVDEPEWFDMTQEVLAALDTTLPLRMVQTWFYVHIAALLGDALSVSHDIAGERLSEQERYIYDVSEKGFRKDAKGNLNASHIKYLRLMLGYSLARVSQVGGIGPILDECYEVARRHAALN